MFYRSQQRERELTRTIFVRRDGEVLKAACTRVQYMRSNFPKKVHEFDRSKADYA